MFPETRAKLLTFCSFHKSASEGKLRNTDVAELWSIHFKMNNKLSYTRDSSQTNNVHIYKGSEHKQMLESPYTVDVMHDFDMRWYPLDTQACCMNYYSATAFSVLHPEINI